MRVGERIEGRFTIEAEVAGGGMGRLFRAIDQESGGRVAIKLALRQDESAAARFVRECEALSRIRHPGVVRHVAHGLLADGSGYLAMEWLEGADLAQRLRARRATLSGVRRSSEETIDGAPHAALSVREAVVLGIRVASALGELHRAGIVHRDVKPGNVFLSDATVGNAKLVDLGAVRVHDRASALTLSGALIGTPFYMAPEQARGDAEIGPPADVFSLACVLYECLCGVAPFQADGFVAVLGRILLEDPVPLDVMRPDVPPALASLIAAMLAKPVQERPKDGDTVAAALEPVRDALAGEDDEPRVATGAGSSGAVSGASVVITGAEHRVQCFLHARSTDPRAPIERGPIELAGASAVTLSDGTLLVAFPRGGAPTQQATSVARLALALRAASPHAAIVLATGRGVMHEQDAREPVTRTVGEGTDETLAASAPGVVHVDRMTATLVESGFEVARLGRGLVLLRERSSTSARTLLGRVTQIVGRKKELSLITATLDESAEEPVARAVVVTGPPGQGKSRVRWEIERTLASRAGVARVIVAQGDANTAGSPFALLGPALRRAAEIEADDVPATRTQKLRALLSAVPDEQRERASIFLGELAAVSIVEGRSDTLETARADPTYLAEQLQIAWEAFLRAECERGVVVIVLDDLQWGDYPSIRLVLGAMRALAHRPLFVLALGHTESQKQFPDLFREPGVAELRLEPLTPRASAELARHVLGAAGTDAIVESIVARAGGNAFFLEELVRGTVEGGQDALPDTVVGTVQARVATFTAEARRVMRAASVFGEICWAAGVERLLAASAMTFGVREWLDDLVAREVLVLSHASRFAGQREYRFRHGVVREAAYAMLTDEDRRRAHLAAAEWLRAVGEDDPTVLSGHLLAGGDEDRAVVALVRAAAEALDGDDMERAIGQARRALELASRPADRAAALTLVAVASAWGNDYETAAKVGRDAAAQAQPGSTVFFAAAGAALKGLSATGDRARADELFTSAQAALVAPAPSAPTPDEGAELLGRSTAELARQVRGLVAAGKRQVWVLRLGSRARPPRTSSS